MGNLHCNFTFSKVVDRRRVALLEVTSILRVFLGVSHNFEIFFVLKLAVLCNCKTVFHNLVKELWLRTCYEFHIMQNHIILVKDYSQRVKTDLKLNKGFCTFHRVHKFFVSVSQNLILMFNGIISKMFLKMNDVSKGKVTL